LTIFNLRNLAANIPPLLLTNASNLMVNGINPSLHGTRVADAPSKAGISSTSVECLSKKSYTTSSF
jgi:hypothetical protein